MTVAQAGARAATSAARRVVDIAALVGVLCALAAVVGLLAGWRPVVLVSGSMAPAMPTGTLVLTRPVPAAEVRAGDVVTVPVPGTDVLVTHRVTAVREVDGVRYAALRGDANTGDDPTAYPLTDPTRRAALHLPWVGRLVSGDAARVLTVGAAALVVLALLPTRRPRPDRAPRPG